MPQRPHQRRKQKQRRRQKLERWRAAREAAQQKDPSGRARPSAAPEK